MQGEAKGAQMSYSKEIKPIWNMEDTFSVEEAAALMCDIDPGAVDESGQFFKDRETGLTDSDGIVELQTTITILCRAIDAGTLKATKRYPSRPRGYDEELDIGEVWAANNPVVDEEQPSLARGKWIRHANWSTEITTIDRPHLTAWLKSKGISNGFFFPDACAPTGQEPDYLNPDHPRYAPKLAAAVNAWQAVTNPGPQTPKQGLMKWLRQHAVQFGLSDDQDGKPNETAIEEIAKVANWKPEGGSAKTPGG